MIKFFLTSLISCLLLSCSSGVLDRISKQEISLTESTVPGSDHKTGKVYDDNTVIYGKVIVKDLSHRHLDNVNYKCSLQFVDPRFDSEIHSHLYGTGFLYYYSNIGSDGIYAAKVNSKSVELSYIECNSVANVEHLILPINLTLDIDKTGRKYYFGEISLFVSKSEVVVKKSYKNFEKHKKQFEISIPSSKKLKDKTIKFKNKKTKSSKEINQILENIEF